MHLHQMITSFADLEVLRFTPRYLYSLSILLVERNHGDHSNMKTTHDENICSNFYGCYISRLNGSCEWLCICKKCNILIKFPLYTCMRQACKRLTRPVRNVTSANISNILLAGLSRDTGDKLAVRVGILIAVDRIDVDTFNYIPLFMFWFLILYHGPLPLAA